MADIQFSSVLKWVGYATAILSLIAGVRALTKVFTDRAETRREVATLLASEQVQLKGKDYASAWQSLDRASKVDANSPAVRAAQENLAMQWLENIRVQDNQKFSDIAEKLDPVLTRGIAAETTGQRQADLLAHLGWSYFLRSREGKGGLDPAASYADAVKKDANNPYAQSMWGHWILWNHGDPEEAARHFSSALASGRERDFVRRLQLAALLNENNDASGEEVVRVLTAMRREGTAIPSELRPQIFSMYYGKLIPPNTETPRFINAVPPTEHVATFRWAFGGLALDESGSLTREGDLAVLEEAADQLDDARKGYESLRKQLSNRPGSLLTAAEAGSKRLAHTQ